MAGHNAARGKNDLIDLCGVSSVNYYYRVLLSSLQSTFAKVDFRKGRSIMPYTRSMQDYDQETTIFKVNSRALTALNFDAEVALNVALGVAIVGVTRGTVQKIAYGNEILSPGVNADPLAQRENKWLVRYVDQVTGVEYHVELGTADLTVLDPNNRGYMLISSGAGLAFKDAFDAYVISPAGNDVVMQSAQFVGRNT